MKRNDLVAPVVKWVGGKRQILEHILPLVPKQFNTYYEPFLGGGAVLFWLQPNKAVINDINYELINVYKVIKDEVDDLILTLKQHDEVYKQKDFAKDYFYKVRKLDRQRQIYNQLTRVEKAARVIFLNKTCFNGLYRVNRSGQFNAPFGYYQNPNIVNAQTLRAVSAYLNGANVEIRCDDFETVLKKAEKGDFAYLDPPYHPVSDTASFTSYDREGFNKEDQIRLSMVCRYLDAKGVKFLLSNSATDLIIDLYEDYEIDIVRAKRVVNVRADGRGEVNEVLVRNFKQ